MKMLNCRAAEMQRQRCRNAGADVQICRMEMLKC
jgi:hypothetical protein